MALSDKHTECAQCGMVCAPNGAKPVKSLPAKPKLDSQPEQTARTAHLAIPVSQCRTTFVGGVNPWGR